MVAEEKPGFFARDGMHALEMRGEIIWAVDRPVGTWYGNRSCGCGCCCWGGGGIFGNVVGAAAAAFGEPADPNRRREVLPNLMVSPSTYIWEIFGTGKTWE